jgi:hypothetical protein
VAPGIGRASDLDGPTVDPDLAGIRLLSARQNLDQGRFSGPVVTEQPHDLSREKVDRNPVDCSHTAKGNADVPHLDQRDGTGRSWVYHRFRYFHRASPCVKSLHILP